MNQLDSRLLATPPKSTTAERLTSLDVYRGSVMLLLATHGLGLVLLARDTDSALVDRLALHVSHPDWISQFTLVGFSLWDMIQPAFMFIVGVAVPFSFAKRRELGESRGQILRHALRRALLLVLLGVFLQSLRASQTNWLFTNVLSQIGLGYGLLILMADRHYSTQLIVGCVILVASWLIYALYPITDMADFRGTSESQILPGFYNHWSIHTNVGAAIDRWFLNLFPRSQPFETQPGGYHTINFIPSSVTMLMGLMCGQWLRDNRTEPREKIRRLVLSGAACLAVALLLSWTVCPIVKRLWTPSWTLYSGAYVIWLLALFYWAIDVRGWKRWTLPLIVVGMNPLAMYFMGQTLHGWVVGQLHTHLPALLFTKPWGYVVDSLLTTCVFWLVCFWMYRRKIFLRI